MAPKFSKGTDGIDVFMTHGRFEVIMAGDGDDMVVDTRQLSHDTVFAGGGDDFLVSDTGRDVLSGGGGDDFFAVGSRSEKVFVFGGDGDDTLAVSGEHLKIKETSDDRAVITDDDGFTLVVRGVEHIDWSQ